jgi:hypothetical protein
MDFRDIGEIVDRKLTAEGFLEASAKIARSGIQEYYAGEFMRDELPDSLQSDPNNVIRLLRPEHEVFDTRVLSAFAHRTVTDGHPPEFVSSKNIKKYQVGFSKEKVRRDGNAIGVDLVIQDQKMIRQIQEGQNQLSAGYGADVVWESGIDESDGIYDGYMTNIEPNHIAIVDVARGGPELRISDSWPKGKPVGHKQGGLKMATRLIDGITVEFSDQAAEAYDKKAAELDAKQGELDATSQKMTDMQARVDKLEGELAAEKAKALKVEDVDRLVSERIMLVDAAHKIAPELECTGLTDSEIRVAAIKIAAPDLDLTDKSADYIAGMFQSFAVREPVDTGLEKLNQGLVGDSAADIVDEARNKFLERSRDGWRKPIGSEVN